MTDPLRLIPAILALLFKSRAELEAENLVLRQHELTRLFPASTPNLIFGTHHVAELITDPAIDDIGVPFESRTVVAIRG